MTFNSAALTNSLKMISLW